ncbi:glycosyltransferase family 2 protein [Salinispirillum sp. LH 10-3-1]|uniref:Glycosyltransferase family 2 protein n=1 Tax=Salinispirillum sp. LH 10-3-1 TaxID=2952525 RepID=A0AB38YK04_9GAMM
MKLKEIPGALFTAFQLSRIPAKKLNASRRPELPSVIVSFTSIPSRIPFVHLTVRSLLNQSVHAEKIVLWLHNSLQNQIPAKLTSLEGTRFEIRFSDQTSSHRKLVHSMEAFPGKTIVTCDDDSMYQKDWLENLYADHLRHPKAIIANRVRQISYEEDGTTKPYKEWRYVTQTDSTHGSYMPTGYGGVLYPPNALHADVTNKELYLKLTPKADDLWFKAMSFLHGTESRQSNKPGPKPITIWGSQKVALLKSNVREDANRAQWDALRAHYNFKTPEPEN